MSCVSSATFGKTIERDQAVTATAYAKSSDPGNRTGRCATPRAPRPQGLVEAHDLWIAPEVIVF